MTFSTSVFHRLLKKAGAERVSDEAAEALRVIIDEMAEDLAKKAVDVAKHAGRSTVMERDIVLITGEGEKEKKKGIFSKFQTRQFGL